MDKNDKGSKDWSSGTSKGDREAEVNVVGGKLGTRTVSCPERKVLNAFEGGRCCQLCQALLPGRVRGKLGLTLAFSNMEGVGDLDKRGFTGLVGEQSPTGVGSRKNLAGGGRKETGSEHKMVTT